MTACTLCTGFGGHHDPIAHGNEPEEREPCYCCGCVTDACQCRCCCDLWAPR